MSPRIVALQDEHLEEAAALFTAQYRAEREHTPSLSRRHQDTGAIVPLLRDLAGRAPGVAAIRNGRLVGFLVGQLLDNFRGRRCVYSPEWANAVNAEDGRRVYEHMYAHLSARWVANGCFTHLVTVLAHRDETLDALRWLGFGLMAVDAMRDLSSVQGPIADGVICRAGPDDVAAAMMLGEELQRYLAAAPTFLAFDEAHGRTYHEGWLSNPDNALWLAYRGDEAVACIGLEPSNPEAAYVVNDEKTVSITRAFTKAQWRSGGIGAALLQHAVDWARSVGHESCAVDFEPENVLGSRFWLRHFQPVCLSLVRHVDARIVWAHSEREEQDIW